MTLLAGTNELHLMKQWLFV